MPQQCSNKRCCKLQYRWEWKTWRSTSRQRPDGARMHQCLHKWDRRKECRDHARGRCLCGAWSRRYRLTSRHVDEICGMPSIILAQKCVKHKHNAHKLFSFLFWSVSTPHVPPYFEFPKTQLVWHGCSECADCENTNFKKNVPLLAEIWRCKVKAWLAGVWPQKPSQKAKYFLYPYHLLIQPVPLMILGTQNKVVRHVCLTGREHRSRREM